jgi:uncharacterized membrane protein
VGVSNSVASAKLLARFALGLGALTLVTMVVLWPTGRGKPDAPELTSFEGIYTATVLQMEVSPCAGTEDSPISCTQSTFRLLEGPDAGTTTTIELSTHSPRTASLTVGDQVVLGHQPSVRGFEYALVDRDRRGALVVLTGIFVIAVVALGRGWGVSALIGLAATLGVLFAFIVPSILEGRDPLLVSVIGSVAIAYTALYLSHGLSTRTTIALIGTLGGLVVAAVLAVMFMGLAEITGLATEEALVLSAVGSDLDLRGLILGGMMIGALGAIDDMTVTQVSAVWELRDANSGRSPRSLVRAGLRIGRDHVASTVNTLVLAYAGASMPLLILFVLSDQPAGIVANGELVATEIVRTLVGSIGLVASVPIATILAAHVVRTRESEVEESLRPASQEPAPPHPFLLEGPEEHEIPDRRRDLWASRLRQDRRLRNRRARPDS